MKKTEDGKASILHSVSKILEQPTSLDSKPTNVSRLELSKSLTHFDPKSWLPNLPNPMIPLGFPHQHSLNPMTPFVFLNTLQNPLMPPLVNPFILQPQFLPQLPKILPHPNSLWNHFLFPITPHVPPLPASCQMTNQTPIPSEQRDSSPSAYISKVPTSTSKSVNLPSYRKTLHPCQQAELDASIKTYHISRESFLERRRKLSSVHWPTIYPNLKVFDNEQIGHLFQHVSSEKNLNRREFRKFCHDLNVDFTNVEELKKLIQAERKRERLDKQVYFDRGLAKLDNFHKQVMRKFFKPGTEYSKVALDEFILSFKLPPQLIYYLDGVGESQRVSIFEKIGFPLEILEKKSQKAGNKKKVYPAHSKITTHSLSEDSMRELSSSSEQHSEKNITCSKISTAHSTDPETVSDVNRGKTKRELFYEQEEPAMKRKRGRPSKTKSEESLSMLMKNVDQVEELPTISTKDVINA